MMARGGNAYVGEHFVLSADTAPRPKAAFYAVSAGHKPGIYTTWAEAEQQVKGFSG
jgi:ribonuclease HI